MHIHDLPLVFCGQVQPALISCDPSVTCVVWFGVVVGFSNVSSFKAYGNSLSCVSKSGVCIIWTNNICFLLYLGMYIFKLLVFCKILIHSGWGVFTIRLEALMSRYEDSLDGISEIRVGMMYGHGFMILRLRLWCRCCFDERLTAGKPGPKRLSPCGYRPRMYLKITQIGRKFIYVKFEHDKQIHRLRIWRSTEPLSNILLWGKSVVTMSMIVW